ncbi:FAD-dependent oxidoreductase [Maribellus sp. YY47]|uniref:FAD-dependent oxidoreductase n=1 Tax=Maribellus sp. YY47 TaxID=2929486 RepID=UPI002000DC6E|nr:FAD-dependent oxidoreductase [Maribellus sp. YY47]MCK3683966.1 FAD-dependent oxidoreductase [Maribellus sp. YY47]
MKRRSFIKTTAAGSAFLMTSGAFAFGSTLPDEKKFCYQSARKIPVAYNVDVVVIGGSLAAVAAAVEAKKSGSNVFLVAMEPYLGEDVCGTSRLWTNDASIYNTELGKTIFGNGLPTPMHVKRTLDNALIENNIDFLYSSYVTDVLSDKNNQLAGVVISNRSGRQAIIAKTIIDATPRAMVARMAGAQFGVYPSGEQTFKFTVVGNQLKEAPGLKGKIQDKKVQLKYASTGDTQGSGFSDADVKYDVIEYSIQINMKDGSWASFAEAEQIARDLTWDTDQVESSDLIFQNPPDKLTGQKRWNNADVDPENINLKVFRPRKLENIFVLSGSANLSDEAAETLLQPGKLIRVGERIGKEAATVATNTDEPQAVKIKGSRNSTIVQGDVGEILEGLRPSLNIGEIVAEETILPVLGTYDVVVMGAGTAGAPAGVGASKQGAKTLVLDYMHGMGGMGTLGMIGRYYHGYRKGYTNTVDQGVRNMDLDNPRKKKSLAEWVFDWKTEYFRREIRSAGGDIWFGVLGSGAYVENGKVKGVVVATPEGRGIVLAHTVIDSTGSADIAIAAGAEYHYTDGLSVAVQGSGLPFKNPNDFYNNTDWTFINDSDMLDVWRAFVIAKDKFKDQYDIGKIPQTRERRRMVGDFTVGVLDVYNGRTYPDIISAHFSSFDTHGFTEDPFFSLKPPAHSGVDVLAFVPFRALLPKGLEGIAVTGLGASAHRDAMPVIRMQPCLQNQGYAVGMAAAQAKVNNQNIRYIDIKALQKELVKIESLPEHVLTDKDNYPPAYEKIQQAAITVVDNLEGLETILWDKERGVTALIDQFHMTKNDEHKLVYARILGMLGDPNGWEELIKAIDTYDDWDEGWNYTGMGQFGKSISYLDSLIIAAGRTQKREAIPTIVRLAEKLTPESHFSHFRAVAIALETIADQKGAEPLFKILEMPGVKGHVMPDIKTAKKLTPADKNDVSTRNNALREIILGRALYKCGDYNGVGNQILNEYSKDLRGHFYRHASGVLQLSPAPKNVDVEL